MQKSLYQYGMIGLGTMGCNLVLNMSDHGFSVAGYDKNTEQVNRLKSLTNNSNIGAFDNINQFVASLNTPRVIMLLVPAGKIVDAVIETLKPIISKDDVIVDCGNSYFADTQNRIDYLLKDGIHFVGLGVSGGETGARFGPSIMPGGDVKAYELLAPMLNAIAAKVNGTPCTAYMGKGAAGHYVKMVHNGIEYALMQMIAETYHVLKNICGLNNKAIHEVFSEWNKGKLQSFLIEITAAIFLQEDDLSEAMLIDKIADTAHQKGTGAWTSKDAMTIGSPTPSIDAAVAARTLSSMKNERVKAASILATTTNGSTANINIQQIEDALYAGFLITYAQGLALLQNASSTHAYDLNLKTIASIWRGGCIIRAAMLETIMQAYEQEPTLQNILVSNHISTEINKVLPSLRDTIVNAINFSIPTPSLTASLHYIDAYKSAWLPANLIQAQRDFFGAHTYERTDKEGTFHTKWHTNIQ
ncbi:NADP-dependent phosphogluconate dehydrogenase [Ferruginibacter yonginensis]|uniref:6-phosphogluconate dehydrogenase, decarboxylating n=1 Tax=Ferruginibacter yonginensis TaxID=1310416 RepID=A0ABV8QVF1_9BACT